MVNSVIVKDYHSVYDLKYHLILVIKYYHQIITDNISIELYKTFTTTRKNYGVNNKTGVDKL